MRTFVVLLSAICFLSLSSCATRVVTRPATVTVIKSPPKHYKIIRVKGNDTISGMGNITKKRERAMF